MLTNIRIFQVWLAEKSPHIKVFAPTWTRTHTVSSCWVLTNQRSKHLDHGRSWRMIRVKVAYIMYTRSRTVVLIKTAGYKETESHHWRRGWLSHVVLWLCWPLHGGERDMKNVYFRGMSENITFPHRLQYLLVCKYKWILVYVSSVRTVYHVISNTYNTISINK